MSQTILGIDLGSYSVKIAQVQRALGEFKLLNFFELPLVAEEVLNYQQAGTAALTQFLAENPLPHDTCVVSLPGNAVSFRVLELPFTNVRKIDQTLEFELESLVPFEINELAYDYGVLSSEENASKVLVTYLPEMGLQSFLTQLQNSGADPRFVGVDTIDMAYLPLLGVLPPESRYVLLDIGHSKTNIVVLQGSELKMVRCFSWGGQNINHALMKALNISYDQAVEYKHKKAKLVEDPQEPALQAIREEFLKLITEVNQTLFSFYEKGESSIEAIYLCGGTSRMLGIENFFSSRLNINVSSLEVLDETYTDLHQDQDAISHIIPTAFASALHGVFPNKGTKINFRRGEYAYKKDIEEMSGFFKKIGWATASVFILAMVYFGISYFTLSSQVSKMNQSFARMVKSSIKDSKKIKVKSAKDAIKQLNRKISGVNDRLQKMQGESGLSALSVLQEISQTLPDRTQMALDVDEFSYQNGRVTMEVRMDSSGDLDLLQSKMTDVPYFKNVESGERKEGKDGKWGFELAFNVSEITAPSVVESEKDNNNSKK